VPRLRHIIWPALIVLLLAAILVATFRMTGLPPANRPLPVPPGDQEIAWFHTATSTATWERFVAAAHYAARVEPRLHVDDSKAFPETTTAVPEFALSLVGSGQRLLFRWYKQSGGVQMADWVNSLAGRNAPPLAIIGAGSSDQALELARIMAAPHDWGGSAPLLFFMTASACNFESEEGGALELDLMGIYKNRSFRFCFNNRQMARAVVDFVWSQSELRPQGSQQATLGAIMAAATGDVWAATGLLACQEEFRGGVYTLEWRDDPYSVDLASEFREVLFGSEPDEDRPWHGQVQPTRLVDIHSSVGTFIRPNADEANAIGQLINGLPFEQEAGDAPPILRNPFPPISRNPLQRSLLILPTVAPPARRILSGITGATPVLRRHLVAVSGDSISFNDVYRDGALIWNVRLVSVPLVFFAQQNPVAWDRTPAEGEPIQFGLHPTNGTDDVLHYADIMRIVAEEAYDLRAQGGPNKLLANADDLADRLRSRSPAYFDADGNRRGGSGEYVVYFRPHYGEGTEVPSAVLETWVYREGLGWKRVGESLDVRYH
jgi:hypothetical protein